MWPCQRSAGRLATALAPRCRAALSGLIQSAALTEGWLCALHSSRCWGYLREQGLPSVWFWWFAQGLASCTLSINL